MLRLGQGQETVSWQLGGRVCCEREPETGLSCILVRRRTHFGVWDKRKVKRNTMQQESNDKDSVLKLLTAPLSVRCYVQLCLANLSQDTQRQNVTLIQTKPYSRHSKKKRYLDPDLSGSARPRFDSQNSALRWDRGARQIQTKPYSRLSQRQNVTLFQNKPNSTDYVTDAISSPISPKLRKGGA